MSGAQRTRRPSTRIQLSAKQANIYTWGWQKDARFRYAVCGRRFGNIQQRDPVRRAPTFKQAKRVMWNLIVARCGG
jgi:hypothetical protein